MCSAQPAPACEPQLPGAGLIPILRARIRTLVLARMPAGVDPTLWAAGILHSWSAFERLWLVRLLPANDSPLASGETESGETEPVEAMPLNLDPYTADGRRLQTLWTESIDEFVTRGRALCGANTLPAGVEELMTDVYVISARQWPQFVYTDRERFLRWLLVILHNLIQQAVHKNLTAGTVPLPDNLPLVPPADATASRAEERELMAARVLVLHGRFPVECRAADLTARVVAQPTLNLFVAADTLETVLGLNPADRCLWACLALRQMEPAVVAAGLNTDANNVNQRAFQLRKRARARLAKRWTA